MENSLNDAELDAQMKERFAQLPKVVQEAITSADVEKRLRDLANVHKLHLDQWESLENEVMLALLGFEEVGNLQKNIEDEVKVPPDIAATIATDIEEHIFAPIRAELERETEPTQESQKIAEATPAAVAPTPATPPKPAPEGTVIRAPISPLYQSQTPSVERKSVEGDPYREQVE